MKTILIATDFSEAADHASRYGVELAKAFQARIILYNAYQVLAPFPGSTVVIDPRTCPEEVTRLLEVQAIGIARSGVAVETYCTEHLPARGILHAAKVKGVDIVIAGMKGYGKNFRKLFGSTATSLARMADLPLIVVPEGTEYRPPQLIGVAYDSDIPIETDVHFLDSICEFAAKFKASLYFLKVVKEKSSKTFKTSPLPFRLNKSIHAVETHYDFLKGKKIADTLNEFVRHRKIDMLAILPHSHSLLARIFIRSSTGDMIFETPVPLLILSGAKKSQAEENERKLSIKKTLSRAIWE